MENKFFFFIGVAVLLIGYYLFVLYQTLLKKRKLDKSSDARELYVRTRALPLLLFGDLFKSNKENKYKLLREERLQDPEGGSSKI